MKIPELTGAENCGMIRMFSAYCKEKPEAAFHPATQVA